MPLAATLATQAIYDGFLDDSRERAFPPFAQLYRQSASCAAGLASLAIFDADEVLMRNRTTAARAWAPWQKDIAALPHVADTRQCGMVVAFELARDGDKATPFDPSLRIGLQAYRAALARGVVLRSLGDILYWMPPYCVDEAALAQLAEVTATTIREVTACA